MTQILENVKSFADRQELLQSENCYLKTANLKIEPYLDLLMKASCDALDLLTCRNPCMNFPVFKPLARTSLGR